MDPENLPGPGKLLTLTGVLQPTVEAGGLMLEGYQILGGPPEVCRAGERVRVTGRVQPDVMTLHQQGTPFVVETAEPAPG